MIEYNTNNNNKSIYNIRSSNNNYYYYYFNLKYNIINIITNINYCSIIYLCIDKGFTYQKEVKSLLGVNSADYIEPLKAKGILQQYDLSNKEKEFIRSLRPNAPINRIKSYRLVKEVKSIVLDPFLKDIFMGNVSAKVKEHKENLIKEYSLYLEEQENIKQQEQLRYEKMKERLAKQGVYI